MAFLHQTPNPFKKPAPIFEGVSQSHKLLVYRARPFQDLPKGHGWSAKKETPLGQPNAQWKQQFRPYFLGQMCTCAHHTSHIITSNWQHNNYISYSDPISWAKGSQEVKKTWLCWHKSSQSFKHPYSAMNAGPGSNTGPGSNRILPCLLQITSHQHSNVFGKQVKKRNRTQ